MVRITIMFKETEQPNGDTRLAHYIKPERIDATKTEQVLGEVILKRYDSLVKKIRKGAVAVLESEDDVADRMAKRMFKTD